MANAKRNDRRPDQQGWEAEKLDHVTLKDWIEGITKSDLAQEFHYAMGTFQTIINDPALNSAGENLKVFLQVQETKVHITNGSWAFAGAPGHRFIVEGFASAVEDAQGAVPRLCARVALCLSPQL